MTDNEKTNEKTENTELSPGIRAAIAAELGKLFASGKADVIEHETDRKDLAKGVVKDDERTGASIAKEVQRELERLRGAEREEDWKKGVQTEVERLKALTEKSPLEVGKFTNWLWGEK